MREDGAWEEEDVARGNLYDEARFLEHDPARAGRVEVVPGEDAAETGPEVVRVAVRKAGDLSAGVKTERCEGAEEEVERDGGEGRRERAVVVEESGVVRLQEA